MLPQMHYFNVKVPTKQAAVNFSSCVGNIHLHSEVEMWIIDTVDQVCSSMKKNFIQITCLQGKQIFS